MSLCENVNAINVLPKSATPIKTAWAQKSSGYQSTPSAAAGEAVKVFVRVRPPQQQKGTEENEDALNTSSFSELGQEERFSATGNQISVGLGKDRKHFSFDGVYDQETKQDTIFKEIGRPLVQSALEGFNGTVFAYGQTGSGKTHTMLGSPTNPGLIPRVIHHMFQRLEDLVQNKCLGYKMSVSYLEIYNERVVDLLDVDSGTKDVRENTRKKVVYVDGLVEKNVASPKEAAEWMEVGNNNRKVGSTLMNSQSSRSHAVFTLNVEMTSTSPSGVRVRKCSKVNLVDLAGSERQGKTHATGSRLKEGANINKSLSALGNVIKSLVSVKKWHVAYRDSKLTFLLRDSLGGNSQTSILAAIAPEQSNESESLSTLEFVQRAKLIKNKATKNEDTAGTNDSLRHQVKVLMERLEVAERKSNRGTEEVTAEIETMKAQVDDANKRAEEAEIKLEALTLTNAIKRKRESSAVGRESVLFGIEDDEEELDEASEKRLSWRRSIQSLEIQSKDGIEGPLLIAQIAELETANAELVAQVQTLQREKKLSVETEIMAQQSFADEKDRLVQQVSELLEVQVVMKRQIQAFQAERETSACKMSEMQTNMTESIREKNALLEGQTKLIEELRADNEALQQMTCQLTEQQCIIHNQQNELSDLRQQLAEDHTPDVAQLTQDNMHLQSVVKSFKREKLRQKLLPVDTPLPAGAQRHLHSLEQELRATRLALLEMTQRDAHRRVFADIRKNRKKTLRKVFGRGRRRGADKNDSTAAPIAQAAEGDRHSFGVLKSLHFDTPPARVDGNSTPPPVEDDDVVLVDSTTVKRKKGNMNAKTLDEFDDSIVFEGWHILSGGRQARGKRANIYFVPSTLALDGTASPADIEAAAPLVRKIFAQEVVSFLVNTREDEDLQAAFGSFVNAYGKDVRDAKRRIRSEILDAWLVKTNLVDYNKGILGFLKKKRLPGDICDVLTMTDTDVTAIGMGLESSLNHWHDVQNEWKEPEPEVEPPTELELVLQKYNRKSQRSAAKLAAESLHLPDLLMLIDGASAPDAVFWCCQNGYLEMLKVCVVDMEEIDTRDPEGYTALHLAAMNGHEDIVEFLHLELKASVNVANTKEESSRPIMDAAYNNNYGCLKFLIDHGADTEVKDESGNTALMYAVERNHGKCIRLLQPEPDVPDSEESGRGRRRRRAAAAAPKKYAEAMLSSSEGDEEVGGVSDSEEEEEDEEESDYEAQEDELSSDEEE